MGLSPEQHQAVDTYLAKHAGDDARLVKALLTDGELSTGDPTAVSPKNARGLMQLTPIALKDLGIDPDTFDYNSPAESLKAGTAYVRLLRDKYGLTNPLQIAAAYNAGPGRVQEAVKAGSFKGLPEETQAYIRRMQAALPAPAPAPTPSMEVAPAAPGMALGGPQSAVAEEGVATGTPPPGAPPGRTWGDTARDVLGAADTALAEASQGALNTVAGVADFARVLPGASRMAEGAVVAGEPTSTVGRYARAAGEGLPFGPVLGVGGSLIGEAGGDVTEAVGLGRGVGEIGAPLATGIAGGVRAVARNTTAIQAEAKAAEAAAKLAVKEARENTQAGVQAMKVAGAEQVAVAERAGQQAVARAEATATTAGQTAVAREVQAGREIDTRLMTATPERRADMLETALRGEQHGFEGFRRGEWSGWMGQHGARPVDFSRVGLTMEDMVDHMVRSGVPLDAATQRARSVLRLMEPVDTGIVNAAGQPITRAMTDVPLANAKELRSELGQIFGKATGSSESRAGRLYGEVSQAIERALPDRRTVLQWRRLNAITKREVRLYRNEIIGKVFDDTPQGAAAADRFTVKMLTGGWTPAKTIELRTVREALNPRRRGSNPAGEAVLQDAVLRAARNKFTNADGLTNYDRLARGLRNPDGFGPLFTGTFRDPRDQRLILSLADEAATARAAATQASEQLAATEARTGQVVTEVSRRGREWTAAARGAGNRETRDAILRARAAATRRGEVVPRANEATAFDRLVPHLFRVAGFSSGGVPGFLATEGAIRGVRGLRWLRQRENRAALSEAMRTTADSAAGRRLIQRLAPNVELPQTLPAVMRGPQAVAAGGADDQVQRTP